jgi:hypothetical protein
LFDDHGPRGLERLSSTHHAFRRHRHLQEVKHAVLMEQARQREANRRNSELLARYSECATQNSRAFASWMGVGDAWAAGQNVCEGKDEVCGMPSDFSPRERSLGDDCYSGDALSSEGNISNVEKDKGAVGGNSSRS